MNRNGRRLPRITNHRPERTNLLLYFVAAGIALCTFVVYLPALRNGFVNWDDGVYVYDNLRIRSLGRDFFRWAFFNNKTILWHPLTWISHAVDYSVWNLDPFGHHLTSIVLHALNAGFAVILTVLLIRSVDDIKTGSEETTALRQRFALIAGGIAGLLFGIHPLHVESVAWVAERKDVLYALFYLLSVISYLRYRNIRKETTSAPFFLRDRLYYAPLILFFLALCSKPMAVTLPVVLLLLDWYPLQRVSSRKDLFVVIQEKLPYIVSSSVVSILTIVMQKSGLVSLAQEPVAVRVLVSIHSLAQYLWKTLAPVNLLPLYPYLTGKTVTLAKPEYWGPVLLVLAITVFCFFYAKKRPFWAAAWLYFLITVFPVLGFVQSGKQSMADRFVYLPGLSLFILAGLGAATVWQMVEKGRLRRYFVAAVVSIILVLSFLTVKQIAVWHDAITLWSYELENVPKQTTSYYLAYLNRGNGLLSRGYPQQAIEDFDSSLANWPDCADAHFNRGLAYFIIGDTTRAFAEYEWVLAKERESHVISQGSLYVAEGQIDKAIEYSSQALLVMPDRSDVYLLRGALYWKNEMMGMALRDYQKACSMGNKMGCDKLFPFEQS